MGEPPSIRWQNVIQSKLIFNRRAPPKDLYVPFTPKSDPLSSMSSYVSTPTSTRNNNTSRKNSLPTPRNSNSSRNSRSESKMSVVENKGENSDIRSGKEKGDQKEKEKEKANSSEMKGVPLGPSGPRLSIRIPGKTRKRRAQRKKRSRSLL